MLQVKTCNNLFLSDVFRRSILITVGFIVLESLSPVYAAGPVYAASAEMNCQLRIFLQKHLKSFLFWQGHGYIIKQGLRYSAAAVSLDGGSRRQYLVYLTSRFSCGSGGCMDLLLESNDGSFKLIERFTLARLPIQILPWRSHGWHDLAMPVSGGGIIRGYTALLKFNGRKYPSNPSMVPRLPAKWTRVGTVVPLSERGILLYQPCSSSAVTSSKERNLP
jgi:hypothetical protein